MSVPTNGAQRASGHRSTRLTVVVLAALLAVSGLAASPPSAVFGAVPLKVVLIVGPFESRTAKYRDQANALAAIAQGYGASVVKIYSPNATWYNVKTKAQDANLLIYLGHGNGWPSPYKPFQPFTKDGLGLNKSAGNGNSNLRYRGEYYIRNYLHLAPNAVVILNHACYTAGNSEPGRADPSKATAIKRVDNYGAGFLRTGAKTVFAAPTSSVSYIVRGLFTADQTMRQLFWSSPNATHTYAFGFDSSRTSGMKAVMDPYRPGKYYRSVIGNLDMTTATWRSSP